jgi:hypothetical protein
MSQNMAITDNHNITDSATGKGNLITQDLSAYYGKTAAVKNVNLKPLPPLSDLQAAVSQP